MTEVGISVDAKTVGCTIARLRKKIGMNQIELAEKLHVTNKAVSQWETGRALPRVSLFPAIADALGVTVDYLMFGEPKDAADAKSCK